MSKNVAVFVDVANIFYAAKAAGVDIDYVTLLKAATAGRDFVRAYAYTGLDPENENQKNFHDFLRRSGYKVVSKDIRKYGDGRMKANLDIELVVDLMRMAQHIDIAVVISGDGDFAPAIRAVQQMGVRVEVISFKGNTSSDLIEVADVFTDISNVAKVEKGVRSGRRIAAEDDLSMTAVPEKETDNGSRRRRGGRREDEREEGRGRRGSRAAAPVAEPSAEPVAGGAGLVALPGERLSRGGAAAAAADEPMDDEELLATEGAEGAEGEAGEDAGTGEGGRRRRRRRGGRGRGRGRRAEGAEGAEGARDLPAGERFAAAEGEEDEDIEEELLEEEVPLRPQHAAFGSVWDTQIRTAPRPAAAPLAEGEEDEDEDFGEEPAIPEYLLAERRAQGRGNRGGRGGPQGRPGYRAALDRERFGRSGTSSLHGGGQGGGRPQGGGGRPQGAGRPQGGGGRPQGGGGRGQAQPQAARRAAPVGPRETAGSAQGWSEVPAEIQALLRAEMAKRGRPDAAPEAPAAEAKAAATRRRTTKAADTAPEAPAAEAKPAATRRRTTKATEG